MDISRIVYDYFFANKEELEYSAFKLREPKAYYDPFVESDHFIKAGIPFLTGLSLMVYISLSSLPFSAKVISETLLVGDIFSREKGIKETNTYCYGLIGRTRDLYKKIIKK